MKFAGLPCRHILLVTVQQSLDDLVALDLFHTRWRGPSEAQQRVMTAELLSRAPARERAVPGGLSGLQLVDRFAPLMSTFKPVADTCSTSDALFNQCTDLISGFLDDVNRGRPRGSRVAARGGAARGKGLARGSAQPQIAAVDRAPPTAGRGDWQAAGGSDVLRGCWEHGHRKNSRFCKQWDAVNQVFHAPLPKPGRARATAAPTSASAKAGTEQAQQSQRNAPIASIVGEAEGAEVDEDDLLVSERAAQLQAAEAAAAASEADGMDQGGGGAGRGEGAAEHPGAPPRPVGNPQRRAPGRGGNNP